MAKITFLYLPGVFGQAFETVEAALEGSWDTTGSRQKQDAPWPVLPMTREPWEDGGICFRAVVTLDDAARGETFCWGVRFRQHDGQETWAIATETAGAQSQDRFCRFRFNGTDSEYRYYLTNCRRLGANKIRRKDGSWGVRFDVWAPHARAVDLVFGAIWDSADPAKNR
ncbi:MAG: hypothetical protein LBG57_14110 [Treponema sp.]|jgi:1,4-alpha-glucan branching enzyme|nr:hypothetical protein [Treponema sp.]